MKTICFVTNSNKINIAVDNDVSDKTIQSFHKKYMDYRDAAQQCYAAQGIPMLDSVEDDMEIISGFLSDMDISFLFLEPDYTVYCLS